MLKGSCQFEMHSSEFLSNGLDYELGMLTVSFVAFESSPGVQGVRDIRMYKSGGHPIDDYIPTPADIEVKLPVMCLEHIEWEERATDEMRKLNKILP